MDERGRRAVEEVRVVDQHHEAAVPGWGEYKVRLAELESAILSDPDLDVNAGIADVEEDLSLIFEQKAG